jgi:membrane protein required for beta-lactamase induction
VVPVIVNERLPLRKAFRRGFDLAKADYLHALGSLATLLLVVFLTQVLLTALLHGGSKQSVHISAFLASLLLQPIIFLGAAMLYEDQAARVESASRNPRRADADLSHADDADRPGSADAPVAP